MKKALVALVLAGFASTAMAAIATSAHDLSDEPGNISQLSSCQYCHTPHNSNVGSGFDIIPLWNRKQTSAVTSYNPALLSDTSIAIGAGSYACLSCHDGVSDMGDTFRGTKGFAAARTLGSVAAYTYASVGTNLQDDHPVGVNYQVVVNQYAAVSAVTSVGLKLYGAGNQVECGTCHDPHGVQGIVGGGSDHVTGVESFLRVAATQICSRCHLK